MCEASQKTKFKCDEIDIIISHQRTLKEAKQYPCDQCDYATSINIKNFISRNVKIPKTKVSDIKHNTFKFRNIYCNINLSFFYRKINSVKHMIELCIKIYKLNWRGNVSFSPPRIILSGG